MSKLTDADRACVGQFVAVVGEVLEECAHAETSLTVLHRACSEYAQSDFIPVSSFVRLLEATGYRRVHNKYGRRFAGLRLKDPAKHHLSFYWH